MITDPILEIGIDERGRLYLRPATQEFPFIYREAAEVHWDGAKSWLYSPKPREWSYLDWCLHIVSLVQTLGCTLVINATTRWVNISVELRQEIETCQQLFRS